MGRDKAMVEIDGRPMVVRVASLVAEVATRSCWRRGHRAGSVTWGTPRSPTIPRRRAAGGLLGGLAHAPHHLVAAVAVDMPFASPRVLRLLAALYAGEDAVVPVTDAGVQPLHAVYATTAVTGLRRSQAEGRPALRLALEGLRVRLVEEREWRSADPPVGSLST